MIRSANAFLRLALAGLATALGLVSFAAGETTFLNRALVDVAVADDGLLAISVDGELLRSTNDGVSFQARFTPDPFEKPQALAVSAQVAIAVCEGGIVMRSSDAGATWSEANAPLDDFPNLNDVASDGSGRWIAVGEAGAQGYLLSSTDDGQNWSAVSFSHPGSLGTIAYDASAGVWMTGGWKLSSGRTGIAFRSTDGTNWGEITLPEGTGSVDAIASNGAGQFGMVGADGFHAVVAANGDLLGSEFQVVTESLLAVAATGDGDWIAGGMEGLLIRFALAGDTLTTGIAQEAEAGAPAVAAFAEGETGTLYVASEVGFEAITPDPKIRISQIDGDLVATATGLGLGREYSLLKSTDLVDFEEVPGSSVVATSGTIRWIVSHELEEITPVFWKLAEN